MIPRSIQRYEARPLTRDLFDKGMAYLEAAKQENFSPETLGVWFNEMARLQWTEQEFRKRVIAVLQSCTYGRIGFDMFLTAEALPVRVSKPLDDSSWKSRIYRCVDCGGIHQASETCPSVMRID